MKPNTDSIIYIAFVSAISTCVSSGFALYYEFLIFTDFGNFKTDKANLLYCYRVMFLSIIIFTFALYKMAMRKVKK